LLLIGVLGLVVPLDGIGLIGLVAHGQLGTPPFARQTLTGQRPVAGQDRSWGLDAAAFDREPQVDVRPARQPREMAA